MEQFVCRTKICAGSDALSVLKTLKSQRLLTVTDRFFVQNGTAQRITAMVRAAQSQIYSDTAADPTLEQVAKGAAVMEAFRPDTVLALGGGSPMDCAKAMVYCAKTPVELVAIPTTSGTGSEVTSFSIVTHEGVKHPLVDDALRPALAILDDTLLNKLPATLIADTGFDVLSHCLEALASTKASPLTDALAQSAFATVLRLLPESYLGSTCVRGQIHLAATMAGMAFDNAGLGVCHALSHALGGLYHVPHGRLNAILLPSVVEYNASATDAYDAVAVRCGLGAPTRKLTLKNLLFALRQLRRQLKLPATLTEAGVSSVDVQAVAQAALQDACIDTNPIRPTKEALIGLVQSVL